MNKILKHLASSPHERQSLTDWLTERKIRLVVVWLTLAHLQHPLDTCKYLEE